MDKPGVMDGSYAIAGHRSHVFGKFFNRLNELQLGERLTFETMEETITYEVFDRNIVEPHEVESLNRKKGIALLSLITCYPENSNKYRLIVHAKRID
jgi:sortase A